MYTIHVNGRSGSSYYISSSTSNRWCLDSNYCRTLSEITTILPIANVSDANISLILLPGYHRLASNLTLSGLTHFSMRSIDCQLPPVINCIASSNLMLYSIISIDIYCITFHGCLENKMMSINEIIIRYSTFSATNMLTSIQYGHAIVVTSSTVTIKNSKFISFQTSPGELNGGAIHCSLCTILISNSVFKLNNARKGGAVYCLDSKILIKNSTFVNNSAQEGGALYVLQSNNTTATTNSMFDNSTLSNTGFNFIKKSVSNMLTKSVVHIGDAGTINDYVLFLNRCSFVFNKADIGGVFRVNSLNVLINDSNFKSNEAHTRGGVGYCFHSTIIINNSEFFHNKAGQKAGVFDFNLLTNATINSCKFYGNVAQSIGGSLYLHHNSKALFTGIIIFEQNSAKHSAVINAYESDISFNGHVVITNNSGSISTAHSTGILAGSLTFIDNEGSLYFFDSEFTINGSLTFTKHNRNMKQEGDYTLEGGCLTIFISRVVISGTTTLNDSTATNGGGVLSISSTIILSNNGKLYVINNTATDTGGGIYLYHTKLYVQGTVYISGNRAKAFGGGVHCISSTIVLIVNVNTTFIKLENNIANAGGGICLEASSKVYIKQLSSKRSSTKPIQYIRNTAIYGGAIFVADNTTSGTCASSRVQSVTAASTSECFIQILRLLGASGDYPHIGDYFFFESNHANSSGAKLFGGLLDRCTVNAFGKNLQYTNIRNSVDMIVNDTSSEPVRVCSCKSSSSIFELNCDDHPLYRQVIKGRNFTVSIAAVDQVNHVLKATIHGSLSSRRGHLGDRQQVQHAGATCTDLNFSIFSPLEYPNIDELILYAKGPCHDLGISSLKVNIEFIPCQCPKGFEPALQIKDRCVCTCHHVLKAIFPFIKDSDCDSENLLFTRNKDFWINIINQTSLIFLTYEHCPSDYCHPSTSPVYIDFNAPNGADVQCAQKHSGLLCGSCQSNLTLSLGSSHCIECPHIWPVVTVAIIFGMLLAGLALVALILVLNLTVAMGTFNGVIFYANVIAVNKQLFMPFENSNFHSVVISWLNLDIGLDVCFFKGMNAYAKAWLQLTFPVYMVVIVVAVITISHHSRKFANLISQKNPVATLATLILLSYAKLLYSIIEVFSYAVLRYTPLDEGDSFMKKVWLRDGSVAYFKGIHIPLFIVAILIVIVGFIYTFLLLSWQWLVRFSDKAIFCWVKSTKLSSFIDAYHAPYTARNRYWTGLLLLARAILYLIAAINVSGEPSVNLLAILLVIGCILLLHAWSGISIYKKWLLNIFEFATYFNILAFTAVKFYVQEVGGNHTAVAYISISAQLVIFLCLLLHHAMLECHVLDKIKLTKWYMIHARLRDDLRAHLFDSQAQHQVQYQAQYRAPSTQTVTFSEITINESQLFS